MPLSSGLGGRGNFKAHNVVYYDELLDAMDQQKAAWKQRVRGIGQGGRVFLGAPYFRSKKMVKVSSAI